MSTLKFHKGDASYYPVGRFVAQCGLNVQGQTLTEEQLRSFITSVCNAIITQGIRKKMGNSVATKEVAKTLAMYNPSFAKFTTLQMIPRGGGWTGGELDFSELDAPAPAPVTLVAVPSPVTMASQHTPVPSPTTVAPERPDVSAPAPDQNLNDRMDRLERMLEQLISKQLENV